MSFDLFRRLKAYTALKQGVMANGEPVSETDFTDIDDTQPPENSLSEKLVVAVDFGTLAQEARVRHEGDG